VWDMFLFKNSLNIEEYIKTHNLDREFCLLTKKDATPLSWRGGHVEMQKLEEFYKKIIK